MPAYVSLLNPSWDGWTAADNLIERIARGERPEHPFGVGNTKSVPIGSTLYILETGPQAGLKARGISTCEPYESPRFEDAQRTHQRVDAYWLEIQSKHDAPALPRELLEADPIATRHRWKQARGGLRLADDVAERVAALWAALYGDPEAAAEVVASGAAREGDVVFRLVKHRKREASHRGRKLETARAANDGRLICEACTTDLTERYGDADRSVAEVHHRAPLGESDGPVMTTLADLAVVCANCHRFIHSQQPLCPVESVAAELAAIGARD